MAKAGHGSLSPYEVRATFVASGRRIKKGYRSLTPTGNVDLAPTLLHLLGLAPPDSMDGRVLFELLADGPNPESLEIETEQLVAEAEVDGRNYKQILNRSNVGGTWYVNFARVERK
jgi:arylsulfatase A-like enzyme